MELINQDEAAKLLDIPELAIGQCIFDGKLRFISGYKFDKNAVISLKNKQSEYLNNLK